VRHKIGNRLTSIYNNDMLEWIAAVDAMEREIAAEAAELKKAEAAAQEKAPPLVVARRIAYMLYMAIHDKGTPPPGNLMDQIM
jgi:hypothetical protein